MTNENLDAITQEAPEALRELIGELHPRIMEAAAVAMESTQDDEGGGKPKVKVSFSITIDLSTHPPSWTPEASVGVRYKETGEKHKLPDPNQPELL